MPGYVYLADLRGTAMDFLISTAHAQAAGAAQPNNWLQLLPLVALFVAFYFLLIRPQTKKAKEHRDMVAKLAVGDEVVTAGGILGRITDAGETFVTVEIASGVSIKVQRFQVSQLMPKGTYKNA
jgi:preprotein translocase subunit YajC